MAVQPKIAIVYLLYYHNESYVDDMVSAIRKLTYPKDAVELVIVINPHPEEGLFIRYIDETVMPESGKSLPHVTVLPQKKNKGFGSGNNEGAQWALDNGFDYVFFHNNDGFFASNALEPLIEAMESDKKIGAAQSLMLLYPETELVNGAGNAFQFLGFGYCGEYRTPIKDIDLPKVKEVGYASGAALMMCCDLMKEYGMWDEDFFMYHEDLEWCMRLRMAGYKIVLVRDSIFYHKYQFARSATKLYWMERNRYGTMLMFFRIPTLILLLPMAMVMELGLILFAIKGGWMEERIKVYRYWLKPEHWNLWLLKRKRTQAIRKVSDRYLLGYSVSGIHFQDAMTDNWVVHKIGNPILALYYWIVVKGLIRW